MAKIMIVDDSEKLRLAIKDFLLIHNHNVVSEASDGIEAIEKYHSEKSELVFLDLAIPKLDGLSVLKKLDFKNPTKIIVITDNDDIKIFENCYTFRYSCLSSKTI